MKRRLGDFFYYLIFPRGRVWRWSYPIWNRLPYRVNDFLIGEEEIGAYWASIIQGHRREEIR